MNRFSYKQEVHKLSLQLFAERVKNEQLRVMVELSIVVALYFASRPDAKPWNMPKLKLDLLTVRQWRGELLECLSRSAAHGGLTRELEQLVAKIENDERVQ
jgi:hypothetical protein